MSGVSGASKNLLLFEATVARSGDSIFEATVARSGDSIPYLQGNKVTSSDNCICAESINDKLMMSIST